MFGIGACFNRIGVLGELGGEGGVLLKNEGSRVLRLAVAPLREVIAVVGYSFNGVLGVVVKLALVTGD